MDKEKFKPYRKITLAYLFFGIFWILLTDQLAFLFAQSNESIAMIQTVKGWVFVFLSGWLIHYLSRKAFIEQKMVAAEKLLAHRSTISGVQHIFLNYLNQMQLITLEAEKCDDFDPELVQLSQSLSKKASEELNKLEKIEKASPELIDSVVYRDIRTRS